VLAARADQSAISVYILVGVYRHAPETISAFTVGRVLLKSVLGTMLMRNAGLIERLATRLFATD